MPSRNRKACCKPKLLVFDRRPWTPWIIEVEDERRVPAPCEGFYGTTFREGLECEQFTLYPEHGDEAYVQVRVFKAGMVTSATFVPAFVRVVPDESRVVITLIPSDANLPPWVREPLPAELDITGGDR